MTQRNTATIETPRASDWEALDAIRRHEPARARLKADLEKALADAEEKWALVSKADPNRDLGPVYWIGQMRRYHRRMAVCRAMLASIDDPDNADPSALPDADGEETDVLNAYARAGDVRALVNLVGQMRGKLGGLRRQLDQTERAAETNLEAYASGARSRLDEAEEWAAKNLAAVEQLEAEVGPLEATLAAFDELVGPALEEAIPDPQKAARSVWEARRVASAKAKDAAESALAAELADLDEKLAALGSDGLLAAEFKARRKAVAADLKASQSSRSDAVMAEAEALVARARSGRDLAATAEFDALVDSCPGAFLHDQSGRIQDALVEALQAGDHPGVILGMFAR